ncbi:hypothetical protein BH11PSE8_BH11PSE8_28180 [soil metagenome]
MKRWVIAASMGAFLMASSFAQSDHPERACLGRVCLGDDASTLTELPWQPVRNPAGPFPLTRTKLAPEARESVERKFRWTDFSFNEIAPYLLLRRVDADGLRALGGVVAVCDGFTLADRFRGTYTSMEGHPTIVTFEPVARTAMGELHFLVTTITRRYGNLAANEVVALGQSLAERYGWLPTYPSATRPGARFMAKGKNGPTLTLLQAFGGESSRPIELRRNPACADKPAKSAAPVAPTDP